MRKLFAVLLFLFLLSPLFGADYYVSTVDGDDGYDGLHETFEGGTDGPWLTWNFVRVQAYAAGDTISFICGGTWEVGNNEKWTIADDGTAVDYITIKSYDTGAKPIFDCEHEMQGSAWNNEGGDVWSTAFSVNTLRVRLDGQDSYMAPNAGAVDGITYLWHWNTTDDEIFVYSPQDPSLEYTNIKVSHNNRRIFYFSDCDYIKIQDVEMRGGIYTVYCHATNTESYITLENCDIFYFYNAIVFTKTAGGGGTINNGTIDGCDIDAKLNLISTAVAEAERCCNDSLRFEMESDDWLITGNTFTSGGHTQLKFKGVAGSTQGSNNNIVEYNVFDGTGSAYSRAWAIDGANGKATGNILRYNIEKNMSVRAQMGGNNNKFYYNLVYAKPECPVTDATDKSQGISLEVIGNICHTNEVYNNVFYDTYNDSIIVGIGVATCIIKNNICMKVGAAGNHPNICIYANAAVGVNNVIENNCCYDVTTADTIDWKGVIQTVFEADRDEAEFSNNLDFDPEFVDAAGADFRLLMASLCVNAGTDVGLTRDYRGRSIRHAPDIGAFEDPTNTLFLFPIVLMNHNRRR